MRVARDSGDAEVRTAYRAVSRKVHPDRPTGSAADQTRLNAAHEKWQALLKAAPGSGRKRGAGAPSAAPPRAAPPTGLAAVGLAGAASGKKECEIRGHGVLLTYQGVTGLRQLRPHKRTKPWLILCDGEHFLTSKEAKKAHAEKGIALWQIPPRSPDQNPIEKFWGRLRRELRRRDLQDWNAKRPPLGRTAYRARLRAFLRSEKTQGVAGRIAAGLLKVCKEVVKKKGAASRG